MAKQKKAPVKKAKKSVKKAAPKKKIVKKAAKKKTVKKKRKPETLMCFLTTACVNYYSLPDDGYELSTLRNYRDTYLALSPGGKELITEYYSVSPVIVKLIEKDKEKKLIYEFIYSKVVSACSEIEKQNLKEAKNVYVGLVRSLMKRYYLN